MRESGQVSLVHTQEAAEEPVSGRFSGSQRPVFHPFLPLDGLGTNLLRLMGILLLLVC